MTIVQDFIFCLKPRCPVCRKGRLFKPRSVSVVEKCDACGAALGQNDVGDGAAVLLIFILGFLLVPAAWVFELAVAPPLWVHIVLWGIVALGMTFLDGTSIRAHHKAAGAEKRGSTAKSEMCVRRLAALAAATARRPA